MKRALLWLGGGGVVGLAVLGAVFFFGMRSKWPPVHQRVRRLSRAMKPLMMRSAGRQGAYASVVHHTGRRSGRAYDTLVVAAPTGDGFVIALPYGATSDWAQNVLAAGSAVIDWEGHSYRVEQPILVPMHDGNEFFKPSEQRSHRRFAVEQCLRVRRVDAAPQPMAAAAST